MRTRTKTTPLRLPQKLAYSALGVAVFGTLACSTQSSSTADAATDALADTLTADATDAPTDAVSEADGTTDALPADDSPTEGATDALADAACVCDGVCQYFCGSSGQVDGAVCPGAICDLSECPLDAGCEPFV
jgi:hypothetical protein